MLVHGSAVFLYLVVVVVAAVAVVAVVVLTVVVVVAVVVVVGNGCVTDPTLFALSGQENPWPFRQTRTWRGGGGGGVNRAFFSKGDFPTVITSRSDFIHSRRASMRQP